MIKLPLEVSKIMKSIEERGYEAYVVGGCVRDSILGLKPSDWDIGTNAKIDEISDIFKDAEIISEKYGVARIKTQSCNVDIATYRVEGDYSDHRRPDFVTFVESINDDLRRRDFTINSIADNPTRTIVDPFDGRKDIQNRLIRSVGDPIVRFDEDPLRILRAIRLAAELNFDLHKSVYEAIVEKKHLIEGLSKDRIRQEFEKIIISKNTGKGLGMLLGTGVLRYIVGEEQSEKLNRREYENYEILIENIDKTKPVLERRLGLFYTVFEQARGLKALKVLEYSGDMEQNLTDAVTLITQIYFLTNKYDLKTFLIKYGMKRYEYLHDLSKAQRIVYDHDDIKIMARNQVYEDIRKFNEPIFIEDLAINGDDLIEAGIAEGEKIGEILLMLVDIVHIKPNLNTKKDLLQHARRFSKSKFSAAFRKLKWIK